MFSLILMKHSLMIKADSWFHGFFLIVGSSFRWRINSTTFAVRHRIQSLKKDKNPKLLAFMCSRALSLTFLLNCEKKKKKEHSVWYYKKKYIYSRISYWYHSRNAFTSTTKIAYDHFGKWSTFKYRSSIIASFIIFQRNNAQSSNKFTTRFTTKEIHSISFDDLF